MTSAHPLPGVPTQDPSDVETSHQQAGVAALSAAQASMEGVQTATTGATVIASNLQTMAAAGVALGLTRAAGSLWSAFTRTPEVRLQNELITHETAIESAERLAKYNKAIDVVGPSEMDRVVRLLVEQANENLYGAFARHRWSRSIWDGITGALLAVGVTVVMGPFIIYVVRGQDLDLMITIGRAGIVIIGFGLFFALVLNPLYLRLTRKYLKNELSSGGGKVTRWFLGLPRRDSSATN